MRSVAVRHQLVRKAASALATLIATPAVAAFTLPANAKLAYSFAAGSAAGVTAVTVRGVAVKAKLTTANQLVTIGTFEEGVTVAPAAGVSIWADTGLGVFKKIAQVA